MGSLDETGKKIYRAIKIIKETFTEEELENFSDRTDIAEAIGPFIALQPWRTLPSDAFHEAKKRGKLLLDIVKLKEF